MSLGDASGPPRSALRPEPSSASVLAPRCPAASTRAKKTGRPAGQGPSPPSACRPSSSGRHRPPRPGGLESAGANSSAPTRKPPSGQVARSWALGPLQRPVTAVPKAVLNPVWTATHHLHPPYLRLERFTRHLLPAWGGCVCRSPWWPTRPVLEHPPTWPPCLIGFAAKRRSAPGSPGKTTGHWLDHPQAPSR